MINKPQKQTKSTPCEVVDNFNQPTNMNYNNSICCPQPQTPSAQIFVQSREPATNPLPVAVNPILFDVTAGNSTGASKVRQNNVLSFKGVGVTVTQAQVIANQTETTEVTISAIGGGAGGLTYQGGTLVTVNGNIINTDLSLAGVGSTPAVGRGIMFNDNKYYTSIPASFISGLPSLTETPVTANSSSTINLIANGTSNHTLTPSLKISGAANNAITVDGQGVYAPVIPINTASLGVKKVATGANFDYRLDGTTIPANTIPTTALAGFQAGVLTALNGGSIPGNGNFTVNISGGVPVLSPVVAGGGTTYTVAANSGLTLSGTNVLGTNIPQIASLFTSVSGAAPVGVPFLFSNGNAYNQIPASAISGLPSITNTPLVANDSTSIDFSTTGTDNHTLTGVVKLSAAVGNGLILNPDGLFSTIGSTGSTYTASQGVSLVGNNFQINGATIPASSIPVSAIANLPSFANTTLTAVDSTSIDFAVSGVDNHTITGAVKISNDAGNLLTNAANGSGLFVAGATSGGSVSTLAGDVTGTNVATTVAKIRGTNVSTIAPTLGQTLVYNGTDLVYTTPTGSITAVSIAGTPSTAAANLSKFQIDSTSGAGYFVDTTGVIVPLIAPLSQVIEYDTGAATTGSIAPQYVGFNIIRAPSAYTKINLETVDFIVKNDSSTAITGNIVLEIQDDAGITIAASGNIPYPAPNASTVTTVAVIAGQRLKANATRVRANVISGGNINLGVSTLITGFAGK